ncbi:MAG: metal ABC transporter permease [Planctomycetota bacterium]
MSFSLALDLFPWAAATLAALCCALLGNFLVLRRQGLLGDAISHAVLPGLVAAFLLTGGRSGVAMFAGAAIAGLATVALAEAVQRLGRVEPGAALGVVFSVMFALGVLLIEQAAARSVDLDADCVLYGQLETLVWFEAPPQAGFAWLASPAVWSEIVAATPRQVWTLLVVFLICVAFVVALFKELRLVSFDAQLAASQGIRDRWMHGLLMTLVAAATVAAFEAVGSILVIAMLIAPAATARLLTDRLVTQVLVSLMTALAAATLGYAGASSVPAWLGHAFAGRPFPAVNAAGSIVVIAGGLVFVAALLSPSHGLVAKRLRLLAYARRTALDDLLISLLRQELSGTSPLPAAVWAKRAVRRATAAQLIDGQDPPRLTDAGRARAADLLRAHRLWETYLVNEADLAPDHVHQPAHTLEHLPPTLTPDAPATATTDPHGRPLRP